MCVYCTQQKFITASTQGGRWCSTGRARGTRLIANTRNLHRPCFVNYQRCLCMFAVFLVLADAMIVALLPHLWSVCYVSNPFEQFSVSVMTGELQLVMSWFYHLLHLLIFVRWLVILIFNSSFLPSSLALCLWLYRDVQLLFSKT